MNKRPAFMFYPADWRKEPSLQSCSLAAHGLWINMICVAHESDRVGYLEINGKPLSVREMARLFCTNVRTVKQLLQELENAGVFSRDTNGTIYSRRMVNDARISIVRAEAGRRGGNPALRGQNTADLVKQTAGNLDKQKSAPDADLNNQNGKQNLTPSFSVSVSSSTSNPKVKTIATGVASRPPAAAGRTVPTWEAYAEAYRQRYGVDPVRNKTTNAHLAAYLERVGADEAPAIAAHFVRSNRALYASAKHATNLLLRDAEALRTEWATRTHGTDTAARQGDRTATVGNVFGKLIDEAETGGRDGTHG